VAEQVSCYRNARELAAKLSWVARLAISGQDKTRGAEIFVVEIYINKERRQSREKSRETAEKSRKTPKQDAKKIEKNTKKQKKNRIKRKKIVRSGARRFAPHSSADLQHLAGKPSFRPRLRGGRRNIFRAL
jgi:hypothetical protein